MDIKHDSNTFYVGDSAETADALMHYVPSGEKRIIIDRTFVDQKLRGQGMAQKLLKATTDWAREQGMKISPVCSFAKREMEGDSQYHDLLD